MSLGNELETADIENGKEVEKLLTASQNNNSLKISWQHNDANKTHRYTIENIDPLKSASNVDMRWDGKPMNIDTKGDETIAVPAAGDF